MAAPAGGIHRHFASPIFQTSSGRKRTSTLISRCTSEDDATGSEKEEDTFNWDKAWTTYQAMQNKQKRSKQRLPLFKLDVDQYVSRSPVYKNYPLSEEVDPIRRDERSFLQSWTDPKFTAAGFSVVIALFVYMFINSPPHA